MKECRTGDEFAREVSTSMQHWITCLISFAATAEEDSDLPTIGNVSQFPTPATYAHQHLHCLLILSQVFYRNYFHFFMKFLLLSLGYLLPSLTYVFRCNFSSLGLHHFSRLQIYERLSVSLEIPPGFHSLRLPNEKNVTKFLPVTAFSKPAERIFSAINSGLNYICCHIKVSISPPHNTLPLHFTFSPHTITNEALGPCSFAILNLFYYAEASHSA
jgi:hypothetical protein